MRTVKSNSTVEKNSHRRRTLLRHRRLLMVERLEDRRLLAVTAQVLGLDNHVVFEGDGSIDTVQFSVVDGYLQHNLARLFQVKRLG